MTDHPGAYFLADQPVEINPGKSPIQLSVTNAGDRTVQVGSHFHFFEVNQALKFDRGAAYGMRLNIPAGTMVRFEPGDRKDVALIPLGGSRTVIGLNGLTNGELDAPGTRAEAFRRAAQRGFGNPSTERHYEVSRD